MLRELLLFSWLPLLLCGKEGVMLAQGLPLGQKSSLEHHPQELPGWWQWRPQHGLYLVLSRERKGNQKLARKTYLNLVSSRSADLHLLFPPPAFHTSAHVCTHMCSHMYTHAFSHLHTFAYFHTHLHAHIYSYTWAQPIPWGLPLWPQKPLPPGTCQVWAEKGIWNLVPVRSPGG